MLGLIAEFLINILLLPGKPGTKARPFTIAIIAGLILIFAIVTIVRNSAV